MCMLPAKHAIRNNISLTRGDGPALAEFSEHDVIQLVVATKSDATVNQAKVSASSFEFGIWSRVLGS